MTTSSFLHGIELDAAKIRQKDSYRLADVIELTCLQNSDYQVSFDEGLDEWLGGNEGLGGIYDDNTHPPSTDSLDAAENTDRKALVVNDVQRHLQGRLSLFQDMYPFIFEDEYMKLKKNISLSHKIYIFILLAANLAFFKHADRYRLATDFEILAAFSLKQIFPYWHLKLFGTARCPSLDAYAGTPREKIEAFAGEIGLRLLIEEEELQRMQTPGGDAGLDIAAWYPFDDGASHMPVFLAQVGCTADENTMFIKQYTVHPDRWMTKLRGLTAIGCMVTPQCYRNSRNSWPNFTDVRGIFIDRFRILRLLANDAGSCWDSLETRSAVESIFS
jgi:hypothetical protein